MTFFISTVSVSFKSAVLEVDGSDEVKTSTQRCDCTEPHEQPVFAVQLYVIRKLLNLNTHIRCLINRYFNNEMDFVENCDINFEFMVIKSSK